jgi:hypothetical protein
MDAYADVKQEHLLHHIPPYLDEDDEDDHESGDDSKRPRLRLGQSTSSHIQSSVVSCSGDTLCYPLACTDYRDNSVCIARACDRCK